jgi:hypothetical protein
MFGQTKNLRPDLLQSLWNHEVRSKFLILHRLLASGRNNVCEPTKVYTVNRCSSTKYHYEKSTNAASVVDHFECNA